MAGFHGLQRTLTLSILLLAFTLLSTSISRADMLDVEEDEIKFGFIKLTDMAPLAIAYEKGYFEDEGLL